MILNERLLRVFLTLAEELHFGRAAAALHMSQPALSGTLKSLENDLGAKLFNRTSRTVELTAAGQVLVVEARRLINESERAVSLVRASSNDILGPLQVGYDICINLSWLGSLMQSARQNPPFAGSVNFSSSDFNDLQQQLIRRNINAALFAGQCGHPELQSVSLFREPLDLVISSRNRLGNIQSLCSEQIKNAPVIWLRKDLNPALFENFLRSCLALGYNPRIVQEVRTPFECLQLVREGLGITFLPTSMNRNEASDSTLFVPLPGSDLHVEYTLAYLHRGAPRKVDQFLNFARHHAARSKLQQGASVASQ